MKYVIQWSIREQQHDINAAHRAQALFEQWKPQEGMEIHQHIGRIDGKGGFAIVETEDPALVARDMQLFNTQFACEAIAVMELDQFARATNDALRISRNVIQQIGDKIIGDIGEQSIGR